MERERRLRTKRSNNWMWHMVRDEETLLHFYPQGHRFNSRRALLFFLNINFLKLQINLSNHLLQQEQYHVSPYQPPAHQM